MSSKPSTTASTAMTSKPPISAADTNPRVVITAHAQDGTSIFAPPSTTPLFHPFGPAGSSFAVFDIRNTIPINNQEAISSYQSTIPRCPPSSVIFCITNITANFSVPMHRTLSLDYAVVISGEIVLKLDNGEEETIRAGEFIVQGGVNHQWINRSQEVCRIAFVMVGAEKVKLNDGRELDATVLSR